MAGEHTYSTGWDSEGDGRSGRAAPQQSGGLIGADPQQAGRVVGTRPTYGGYTSTVKVGPDGKLYNDAGASGQMDAINRYRGLGAAAASRAAFDVDYSGANDARDVAYQSRGREADGANLLLGSARGGTLSQTQAMGRGMIDSQLQGQLGASAGAKGGLAMAAANANAARAGAFMGAQNAGQLAGVQAGEMSRARDAYMSGMTGMRKQDLAQQGMSQHQILSQAEAEMQQRSRNAHQQMGYEGLAYGVNQSANNAAMAADQADEGVYTNSLAIDSAEKNRALGMRGAMGSSGGTGLANLSDSLDDDPRKSKSNDGYSGGIYRNSPY